MRTPTRRLRWVALALLVWGAGGSRVLAAEAPSSHRAEVLIGLIPEFNIFKQKARFTLLGEYLSRKIGVPVKFTILSRYGNILESFESERMDAAFFGSFTGARGT
jgi:phosphonate transport system substrate-binding protein